ncbi:DUF3219 family protein [Planomicrobium sp. CPCC 101079]|uniref:DUF3219 family protein n=1 Tax=Planomicrobium sp. CPCC 101079 TaxID=2599618 RepID=UPI0011B501E3|nr:DUF3219 family protein [Planomicrobium sp. CPCC 101079]TWT02392.1 DUF3219 family protein [Planomicrobium sp. CPCC 101079]
MTLVWIDDTKIDALNFRAETIPDAVSGKKKQKITFDFKVTSAEYHDIAVLLYKMEFRIRVPEKEMDFFAAISNYSTSITNLYKENQVADYKLELTEKA